MCPTSPRQSEVYVHGNIGGWEGAGLVQNLRPWDRQCGCHIQSSVKHMSLGVLLYKRGWKCSII